MREMERVEGGQRKGERVTPRESLLESKHLIESKLGRERKETGESGLIENQPFPRFKRVLNAITFNVQ